MKKLDFIRRICSRVRPVNPLKGRNVVVRLDHAKFHHIWMVIKLWAYLKCSSRIDIPRDEYLSAYQTICYNVVNPMPQLRAASSAQRLAIGDWVEEMMTEIRRVSLVTSDRPAALLGLRRPLKSGISPAIIC